VSLCICASFKLKGLSLEGSYPYNIIHKMVEVGCVEMGITIYILFLGGGSSYICFFYGYFIMSALL
jgi:hypothetical protein